MRVNSDSSKICGREAGAPRYPREHPRPDLVCIMEREDKIRPAGAGKRAV